MVWRGGVVLVVVCRRCVAGAGRPLEVAWCVGGGVAVCGVWWWNWCGGIGGVELVVVRCGVGVVWVWRGAVVRSGGVEELVWCAGSTELVWWEWRSKTNAAKAAKKTQQHKTGYR